MMRLVLAVLMLADVSLIPERTVVPLPGDESSMEVLVRNLSELELEEVRLAAEAEQCAFRVEPQSLPRLGPADRASFRLTLVRTEQTKNRRFSFWLRLSSRHHPRLRSVRLIASGRKETGDRNGWIDVGVVKIVSRKPATRTLIFALLGLVPLAALLALGWYLKRRARAGQ